MKIEFSHDKSDFVQQSLKVKDEYSEEYQLHWLIWVPVILMSFIALDYYTYGLRETIAKFFPNEDPTAPFVFGLLFGTCYAFAIGALFLLKRWTIYLTIVIMIGEWFFFNWYNLLVFRTIDGETAYYPMFGEGMIPWFDGLEPLYSLITRQLILLLSMLLLWKKFR